MDWQTIIVAILLTGALVIAVIHVIRVFSDPLRKCKKCSEACGDCSLADLKRELEKKKKSSGV